MLENPAKITSRSVGKNDAPSASTLTGVFLLSAATLLLELCLTRILSVTLWYHFAFMVISTALFGIGFAGVVLSLRRNADFISERQLIALALGSPIAFIAGYLVFQFVPFEPFSLATQIEQWLYLPIAYVAISAPFFFSGATIASLITRYGQSVHRLYWYDLMGAGLGSILIVFFLPLLGGPATVAAATFLASISAALIAVRYSRIWFVFGLFMAFISVLIGVWSDELLPLRISSNKVVGSKAVPIEQVLKDKQYHRYTAWNTLSRVDVLEYRDRVGNPHRNILIDAGTAMTRLAHASKPLHELTPTQDEEGYFVRMYSKPAVLVVGSGGGREVMLALRNGAHRIVAVEINPDINHLVNSVMADFTGFLYQHPRVEVHTDEARSFLRRSRESYHVISCPHTISNAALSSGSLSLSENHLMTIEAFHDYFDHLEPEGVLVITRPEAHIPRLFSTARELFQRLGRQDLFGNVLAWRQMDEALSFYAGIALKKTSFTAEEVETFSKILQARKLEPLYLPNQENWGIYSRLLSGYPIDKNFAFAVILEPATDDKPYFNQRIRFSDLSLKDLVGVFSQDHLGRTALEERPVAEAALVVLLAQTLVIALLFMLVPIWIFRRRKLADAHRFRTLLSFAALGLGYIIIEVGFIQRFSLFLGRPVVVFSCVLGTLLLSSGFGSAWSQRYQDRKAPYNACFLIAIGSTCLMFLAPWLVDMCLFLPLWSRVFMVVFLLAPLGFIMGMPYPLLLRRLHRDYPERVSWAFGINGFASVTGSIGSVIMGMAVGYTLVLCFGVLCYAIAAAVVRPWGSINST